MQKRLGTISKDILSGRLRVFILNSSWKIVAKFRDLSPLLRRVVFVGEAALGAGFDFEGVRLGD
jgi:hypothetical protein